MASDAKLEAFYNNVKKLLPYRENSNLNFRRRLKKAFSDYHGYAFEYGVSKDTLDDIDAISERLSDIVLNSEKGLQSTAYTQLQNLIQGKKNQPPKIDITKSILPFDGQKGMSFYRIRQMESIYEVGASEMFHIPLNKRGIVKTQRYSTPGYPCLYLGESIYGCWEEMRRPSMQTCAVSRLQCEGNLNIIDLTIPLRDSLKNPFVQKYIPLLISCMMPVHNYQDTYKPEYIVPQLIIEWILKHRTSKKIDGVCYTSTHINNEFNFPEGKFINYAIPVYNLNSSHRFCKKLCSLFRITKPTTNDIEKLKNGYPIDAGYTEYQSDDKFKEWKYSDSDFGNLEKRLNDETYFPLETLSPKA